MENPTERKILQKAQQLLQERGYQYLSFQDLADAVGIRKASVHHYFKTKEDLARSMVGDYQRRIQKWMAEQGARKLNARQKLHSYFDMFCEISKCGRFVCPAGSLLLDWNSFSKSVREELKVLGHLHKQWLTQLFEEAHQQKISRISREQIPSHVILLRASLQGALQLARASHDPERVLRQIFKQIEEVSLKGKGI